MTVGDVGARPLPGIDIHVEADGEITLAPAETGPWARCWSGAVAYWGQPDRALWRNGRIHTGDVGRIDDHGLLHVEGRRSDMITRGGATIAPAEVERVIAAIDGVQDVAVFGVDDERLGQRVAAAIVGSVDASDVRDAVRRRLSGYKVAGNVVPARAATTQCQRQSRQAGVAQPRRTLTTDVGRCRVRSDGEPIGS